MSAELNELSESIVKNKYTMYIYIYIITLIYILYYVIVLVLLPLIEQYIQYE